MADAKRDNNYVTTLIAALDSDGSTPTLIEIEPTAHKLCVSYGNTGSDLSGDEAIRDSNRVVGMLAVSDTDGTTPVPLYADSNGKLLVDRN